MPGDFLKLIGFDGPDTATGQLPSNAGTLLPASTLTNVFTRANYFMSWTNPVSTAFGGGAATGKVSAEPVGVQLGGSRFIPPLFAKFLSGTPISRAVLFSTAAGGSGDWVARFTVFEDVIITSFQTFADIPQGEYPLQFTYSRVLLGHVPSAGAAAVTAGWSFTANAAWNGGV